MIRTMAVSCSALVALLLAGTLLAADESDGKQRPDATRPDANRASLFEKLDANHDGQITSDEVPEEHRRLFQRVVRRGDRNGDSKVNREEFTAAMAEDRPAGPEDRPDDFGPRPGDQPGNRPREFRPDGNRPDGRPQGPPEGRRPDGQPGGPGPGGFGGPMDGRPGPMMGMAIFRALDRNSDGRLDTAEIAAAAEVLKKLDKNSDGEVTREELVQSMPDALPGGPQGAPPGGRLGGAAFGGGPGQPEMTAEATFKFVVGRLDRNSDGKLQKDELPPALQERFDTLDANKNGVLEQSELGPNALPRLMRNLQDERPDGARPRRPEGERPAGERPERPLRRPGAPEGNPDRKSDNK